LHQQQTACNQLQHRLGRGVGQSLNRRQLQLQPLAVRFQRGVSDGPMLARHRLDKFEILLSSLDPGLVLQRGYAWLQNQEGRALSSVKDLKAGQQVQAQLADGHAVLTVNATSDKA
jgi:exodeoxyribonuclease VII large subunit